VNTAQIWYLFVNEHFAVVAFEALSDEHSWAFGKMGGPMALPAYRSQEVT
jgi:hypothetical protein